MHLHSVLQTSLLRNQWTNKQFLVDSVGVLGRRFIDCHSSKIKEKKKKKKLLKYGFRKQLTNWCILFSKLDRKLCFVRRVSDGQVNGFLNTHGH